MHISSKLFVGLCVGLFVCLFVFFFFFSLHYLNTRYRGTLYDLAMLQDPHPDHVSAGVIESTVDGKKEDTQKKKCFV